MSKLKQKSHLSPAQLVMLRDSALRSIEQSQAESFPRLDRATESTSALKRQVGGDHYKGDPIQHVEFCQKNKLTWCESAALKYMVRHRRKNGSQDIKKAIHYLELLLEIEYPESKA